MAMNVIPDVQYFVRRGVRTGVRAYRGMNIRATMNPINKLGMIMNVIHRQTGQTDIHSLPG